MIRKILSLMLIAGAAVCFTACDDDDDYWYEPPVYPDGPGDDRPGDDNPDDRYNPLVSQWQGSIAADYYADVWGVTEGTLATICEFTDDGYGAQLDYDTASPLGSYAYSPFTWTQTTDAITVTYQSDGEMSAARISDYALTSASFTGSLAYGGSRYAFNFAAVEGFDWSPYISPSYSEAKTRLSELRSAGAGPVRCGAFAR